METQEIKELVWVGSSLEDLKECPDEVKHEVGFALHRAQEGKKHHRAKPLKGFKGVFEIVAPYHTDTYRTVYAVKIGKCIYVLHTFKKKAKSGIKTPMPVLKTIRARLKQAMDLAKEE